LATNRTTNRARAKQPAAILAVRRFVEATIKAIPQNEEPRSGKTKFVNPTQQTNIRRIEQMLFLVKKENTEINMLIPRTYNRASEEIVTAISYKSETITPKIYYNTTKAKWSETL